jgi:hypothetical protein
MMRNVKTLAAGALVTAAIAVGVSSVLAAHNEPQKAAKFLANLVTAYNQCAFSSANATTSNGFPACNPAVASGTCAFGTKGKGQILTKVKVDTAGLKGLCSDTCKGCTVATQVADCPTGFCDTTAVCIDSKLTGIDTSTCPVGTTLSASSVVNATSDDCPGGSACTVTIGPGGSLPLLYGFPAGSCTVTTKGECKNKGTINGQSPGTLVPGTAAGIEIGFGYALQGGVPAFSTGILVP